MAFILGIYEELINSIKSIDLNVIRLALTLKLKEVFAIVPWQFLLAVFGGILLAVFSLSKGLEWLLENRPVLIWSFFFGLVLASCLTVSKRVKNWNAATLTALLLSAVGAFILVGLVPVSTPDELWFIFLSGVIAICAMILPGISGSFILVLLGKYQYILGAVNNRDFLTLIVFMLGAGIGIITFARFISWLFNRYHDLTVAVLIGLMIGSLRKVWPWKETISTILDRHGEEIPLVQHNILPVSFNSEVIFAIGLVILGIVVVVGLENMAMQQEAH
jgi:putative membrane protein